MNITCNAVSGGYDIETALYLLQLRNAPAYSTLYCKSSRRRFNFIAAGDCRKNNENDLCEKSSTSFQQQTVSADSIVLRTQEKSAVWRKKSFVVRAEACSISFCHELEGTGSLEDVRFFRSCRAGDEYGFAGDINEVYCVAPNFREQNFYHPAAQVVISNGNDYSPTTGGHAIASVPHVMALKDRQDTAALGCAVFAEPGEYLWDEFIWNPPTVMPPTDYSGDQSQAGGFAITYYGKKNIEGFWQSPQLVFTFPEAVNKVLDTALEHAYTHDLLPRPGRHASPEWYFEPIYCPWHDQSALSHGEKMDIRVDEVPASEYATDTMTDHWLEVLDKQDIHPGTLIIDAKWQKSLNFGDPDPEKWQNMRQWIDRKRQNGLRTFLWYAAWHNEDIDPGEAITRDGKVVCGDPTNPAYEKRLREMVRKYISDAPDCLNADGIKVDGLLGLPTGKGLKNMGNIWGLELQKKYLEIMYSELKKHKPEACLSVFTANPYLDRFSDMIRLADLYTNRLSPARTMLDRAALIKGCHPDVPIDCDGGLYFHQGEDYMQSLYTQLECGIPCIYTAEYIRTGRFFFTPEFKKLSEQDYQIIREVFQRYRQMRQSSTMNKG